ncbi:MAG: ABC transporter ATP-binding protein [Proteobacteria bacterium]|nr:ABC transporter ATP-binding protein [Pseudomonadota bacterium]
MDIYKRLLIFVKPYWTRIAIAVVCMILLSGINALIAYMVKPAIDEIFLKKDSTMLAVIPFALILAFLLKGSFDYGQEYLMGYVGNRVVTDIRDALYRHTQHLSLAFFHKITTGMLMSRIANDIGVLQRSVSDSIAKVMMNCFLIIGLTGVAFYQNWRLACVCFLILPWVMIPITRFGKKSKRYSRRSQEKIGHISTFLTETISGNRIVKAFCMENYENARFADENNRLFRIKIKTLKVSALSSPVIQSVGGLMAAATIYYGGSGVISGDITTGQFFSFIAALGMLYKPVQSMNKVNQQIQEGMAAAVRVFAIFDTVPDIADAPGATPMPLIQEALEFRAVSFRYEEKPVLRDVSFRVNAGKTVAIVGPSGAGKTTIANLILRFYDVVSGGVFIDGVDIRERTIKSVRDQMAIVTQDTILFNDTVLNNIAYGSRDKTEQQIIDAARAAFAHDFIEHLPQGYQTIIGEQGARLSGGQRQKIAIARAILKGAPILILDEATSSLDSRSEKELQRALENLMQGKTTIMIAHRLSTVRNADRIIVMSDGTIAEEGSHEELLQQKGIYYSMYTIQSTPPQKKLSLAHAG